MTEEQTAQIVLKIFNDLMGQVQNPIDRAQIIEMTMMTCHDIMRSTHGDQFVLGWLDSATETVKNKPKVINLQTGH